MTERRQDDKPYVFLNERMSRWANWFEVIGHLLLVGFFLLCAIYSTRGFWVGLWDAMKHM